MVWISVGDQRVSLAEFRDSWFFGQLERQSKMEGLSAFESTSTTA